MLTGGRIHYVRVGRTQIGSRTQGLGHAAKEWQRLVRQSPIDWVVGHPVHARGRRTSITISRMTSRSPMPPLG